MKTMRYILIFFLGLTLLSCNNTKGKKSVSIKKHFPSTSQKNQKGVGLDSTQFSKNNLRSFEKGKVLTSKITENGLVIKWLKPTIKSNPLLKTGEVVLLEYRMALPDGKIIDGNNRLNMPFIPYMVGYNNQTKGWDLAMNHLRVGDFVKVEIPAMYAYGEKGLKGIIPPNTNNWLYIKVLAKVSPELNENGVKVWTFQKGISSALDLSKEKEISYHAIVSSQNKALIMNSYRSRIALKYIPGQKNIVPGLRRVLNNAKKDQKMFVLISPEQAYGNKGYANLIQPNETLFFNLTIKDVRAI
jgi:FK506-binding protein 1